MNQKANPTDASLPVSELIEIDKVCRQFEAEWKAGRQPKLSDFLGTTPEPKRSELKRELGAIEAEYRRKAKKPTLEVFIETLAGSGLMTRAEVFHAVGGFDEQTFAVAFNDIDLCLKIGQKGYRVLYTPYALLYHHEAFSKSVKDLMPHPDEVEAMQVKWKDLIEADPFYSPNLTRTAEDYSLQKKAT